MDLDAMRRSLTYGVPPLTLDEVRWLWDKAFPDLPLGKIKKRCQSCGGEGCQDCDWSGRRLEQDEA